VQEDRLLLRQMRRGDQTALRRIYGKYKDGMLTIAASILSDLAAAEDCVHDVFVDFAAGVAQFRLRSSLKGYLLTCVANRARDQLRKESRQASVGMVGEIAAGNPEPGTRLIEREQEARLYEALAGLPVQQRQVVALHLQGQLTFREIGRQQGVSTNTVQSRYRYGLEKLRALLETGG